MSAPLPTEEDVLAVLLLWAARPTMANIYDTEQIDERAAWNAAVAPIVSDELASIAGSRLRSFDSFDAAIADTERRWEIERAEREVIAAAERWWPAQHVPFADQRRLVSAITHLREVRRGGR